jgi:hypothetical protein
MWRLTIRDFEAVGNSGFLIEILAKLIDSDTSMASGKEPLKSAGKNPWRTEDFV